MPSDQGGGAANGTGSTTLFGTATNSTLAHASELAVVCAGMPANVTITVSTLTPAWTLGGATAGTSMSLAGASTVVGSAAQIVTTNPPSLSGAVPNTVGNFTSS